MSFIFLTALRGILIAVAIAGTMALSRKIFPASRKTASKEELDIEALDERFLPLKGRVISAMILIGIAFGVASYFALIGINRALALLDNPGQFRFFPESAIWWFFPGFGAICLCWELTLQLWALFSGHKLVNLFSDWTNNTTAFWGRGSYTGIDSRKVLRWLAVLTVLPIEVFTALALNMHTVMNSIGIRECGYAFKACSIRPYSSIRRMAQIQGKLNDKGQWIDAPAVILDFSDGSRWSSTSWGGIQKSLNPALLKFLEGQTHHSFEHYVTEADIPPLTR